MNYYIECRNVFDRSNLSFLNEDGEVLGNVVFNKVSDEFQAETTEIIGNTKYYFKSSPLKLKKRYVIFDAEKQKIGTVGLGVKIIHSIIDVGKYYFVKSAFWKIKYTVYDNRNVIGTLDLVRKDKKRYFKITSIDNDFLVISSLFLLAHAVRLKSILN